MAFVNCAGNSTDNDLRKQGLFCDAVIEAAAGRMFPVHKNVLLTAAPSCASLFVDGHKIRLPNVEGDILESLLEFMYTGRLTLTVENEQATCKLEEVASLFGFRFGESTSGSVLAYSQKEYLPSENVANSDVSMRHQIKEIDPRLLAVIHEFWLTGKMTVNLEDAELVDLIDSKLEETAAMFGLNFNDKPSSENHSQREHMQQIRSNLNVQTSPTFTPQRFFKCEQCQMEFNSETVLTTHKADFHANNCIEPQSAKLHTATHTPNPGRNGLKQLWQFLLLTLLDKSKHDVMAWHGNDGAFVFVNPQAAAKLWGRENAKPNMTYGYLQRALRNYYRDGILAKCKGKNRYRFACDMELLVGLPLKDLLDASRTRDARYKAVVNVLKNSVCLRRGDLLNKQIC